MRRKGRCSAHLLALLGLLHAYALLSEAFSFNSPPRFAGRRIQFRVRTMGMRATPKDGARTSAALGEKHNGVY
jgi:hypothetical protein